MLPGIEQIVKQACLSGVENIFIGTAHRGRLTLLTTVLGMPYKAILSKFQGNLNLHLLSFQLYIENDDGHLKYTSHF